VRLVVQVPCLNEEETLPAVLSTIPRSIPGIDEILVLIIDDGSTDRTVEVAREHGVVHFVRHARNRGSAGRSTTACSGRSSSGPTSSSTPTATTSTRRSASPTWCSRSSPGRADIVIADRQVHLVEHFSGPKVLLQKVGSRIVNKAASTDLPDAASGFRAYSRDSLMLLNTITRFSYCMETIIQAGNKSLVHSAVRTGPMPYRVLVAG
jgi:glycosyltransferase involved in cell wall biosynthesis